MPTAHDVARELGGTVKSGTGWLCRCPVQSHGKGRGDKNPSLSVADGEKGLVWKCWAGCSQEAVRDALESRGLLDERRGGGTAPRPLPASRTPLLVAGAEAEANREAAHRIWQAARPADETLVEAYLVSRGLTLPDCKAIRFAQSLKHPSGDHWPAMVCAVQAADGRFLGVHRTFLAHDGSGKAPVSPAKMSLGPISGGAVHLGPAADGMLVGEGIESTLAGMQVSGRPGWAALSTSGMRALRLPGGVKDVTILMDADEPGEQAARVAAGRWTGEGRTVRMARPPSGCNDFNDALTGGNRMQREQVGVPNG
ncbi:MAG: toprim domain-containing protein [Defluviicoccus sp.]|nr:toprim domain-containing protein [Defluviicoccus sp.]